MFRENSRFINLFDLYRPIDWLIFRLIFQYRLIDWLVDWWSLRFQRAFELHHARVNGRPINVEATIIGGKKSKHREAHIKDWTARMQKAGLESAAAKKAKVSGALPKVTGDGDAPVADPSAGSTLVKTSKRRNKFRSDDGSSGSAKKDEGEPTSKKQKSEVVKVDAISEPDAPKKGHEKTRAEEIKSLEKKAQGKSLCVAFIY